jgi:hypothetical protein
VTVKLIARLVLLLMIAAVMLRATASRADDTVLPLPAEDQKAIAKRLGANVVGEPVASKPIGDPTILFPLHHEHLTYRFTSGKNVGKTQTAKLIRVQRPGGKFVWRLQLAPSLVGYLRQAPGGEIDMPSVEDLNEGAMVLSTPGNPFLPKNMRPGQTISYAQKVSVRYLDDLSDEKYTGTLKSDYTYVGTYKMTVPAGTFEAVLLRVTVDGKVGPAKTHGTSYSFFAPGVGLVAMILQQKVSAFWIYNVDAAGGKVLAAK